MTHSFWVSSTKPMETREGSAHVGAHRTGPATSERRRHYTPATWPPTPCLLSAVSDCMPLEQVALIDRSLSSLFLAWVGERCPAAVSPMSFSMANYASALTNTLKTIRPMMIRIDPWSSGFSSSFHSSLLFFFLQDSGLLRDTMVQQQSADCRDAFLFGWQDNIRERSHCGTPSVLSPIIISTSGHLTSRTHKITRLVTNESDLIFTWFKTSLFLLVSQLTWSRRTDASFFYAQDWSGGSQLLNLVSLISQWSNYSPGALIVRATD